MQVILLNTNNGSAFEMKFLSAGQMKNYLEKNSEIEFLSECNSYLPTRHQRMQHPVWKARSILYAKSCSVKHNTTFIHLNIRVTRVNDLMSVIILHATVMASGSLTYLMGCSVASNDCNEVWYRASYGAYRDHSWCWGMVDSLVIFMWPNRLSEEFTYQ